MKLLWLGALMVAALPLAACDDDDSSNSAATVTPAGSATGISGTATASSPAPGNALPALDASFGDGGIAHVALDPGAHDRFLAVAYGSDGSLFATGFVNQLGDQAMVLAKVSADGTLDSAFGDGGMTIVNVASGGKSAEVARAVVVLEDGKIIIGGPVEHDTSATGDAAKDTDIAVLRFNQDGTLDGEFGDEGIAVIDLSAGKQVNQNTFVGDNSWGIGALPDGRVVILASSLAEGDGRTDSDLLVVALDEDGERDTGFGDGGRTVIDVARSSINPRGVLIEEDGTIVATGYGSINGVVQPVLARLSAAGELDASFGDGGIATAAVLPGVAESYAVYPQGDHYITAGYGRGADTTEKVDLIVNRWSGDGRLDKSFGEDGTTRIDLAGQDDRARNVIVLPDGRIVAVGSGKLTEANVDAMVVLLTEDGEVIGEFGTDGHQLTDLGGPSDAFYGVALSPDGTRLTVAGYSGAATDGPGNDDAVLAAFTLK